MAKLGLTQNNMEQKKVIALTGGIGSGKSYALKVLESNGYQILSSDAIVCDLYEKRKIKLMLKKLFPTAVKGFFNPVIDRKQISSIVFNDNQMLIRLTDLITPLVMAEIEKRVKKLSGKIFVEVPLLFECSYQNNFDGVIVITRDKNSRIESVKKRSNLTEEHILKRMESQFDYQNADLTPYTVIDNDGNKDFENKILSVAKNV